MPLLPQSKRSGYLRQPQLGGRMGLAKAKEYIKNVSIILIIIIQMEDIFHLKKSFLFGDLQKNLKTVFDDYADGMSMSDSYHIDVLMFWANVLYGSYWVLCL